MESDYKTAHDVFINVVAALQLCGECGLARKVYEDIVAFGNVVDRVCQLALAPLVDFAEGTVLRDQRGELLRRCLDLVITDRGIDDEQRFVRIYYLFPLCYTSLWTDGHARTHGKGVGSTSVTLYRINILPCEKCFVKKKHQYFLPSAAENCAHGQILC